MRLRYFVLVFVLVLISVGFFYMKCDRNYAIKRAKVEEIRRSLIDGKWKDEKYDRGNEKNNGVLDGNVLKSRSACLYDCKGKRVLYGKNAYEKMPMASTTKILTCIVALENGEMSDECVVSRYAQSMPKVRLGARMGKKFLIKDLMYSLMLESHNDTAVVIAEHIGARLLDIEVDVDDIDRSKECVDAFVKLMNKKVKELGLSNSNFVTVNGLDADKHYTTAVEMAKITDYAIKNEEFLNITNTRSYSFSSLDGTKYVVNNKNQFLNSYDGAIGCKTGYTSKAGYCFVGAIDKGDYNLVSVVFGCGWPPNKTFKWQDTKKLMDYGVNNYKLKEIDITNSIFNNQEHKNKEIEVEYGFVKENSKNESKIIVNPTIKPAINSSTDEKISLLLNETDNILVEIKLVKRLIAPIEKNDIIGYAYMKINDSVYKTIDIRCDKDVKKLTYIHKFTELLKYYMAYNIDIVNFN